MSRRPVRLRGLAVLAVLLAAALAPAWTSADEGGLRHSIDRGKARERSLAGAAAHLGRLEAAMGREVAVLERRLGEAQAQMDAAQARLAVTQGRLGAERSRLRRLRARLAESRTRLEALLRERYMGEHPTLVTVVLDSRGFADLLERMTFLRRVEEADTEIVGVVRRARGDAAREARVLARLQRRQAAAAADVAHERDALAGMRAAADERRATLAEARAARLAALHATRADRRRAQRTLSRLLARRARAARAGGPGGPWAIPWPVVQCESGGQNLPPNSAGASGYYQMLPATWKGLGGSTPQAYQASKAEQDRLAARLWAGGAGASNWVCAVMVGEV
jgi:peptidoglycan hydrolase CwlO-like protein